MGNEQNSQGSGNQGDEGRKVYTLPDNPEEFERWLTEQANEFDRAFAPLNNKLLQDIYADEAKYLRRRWLKSLFLATFRALKRLFQK